MYMAQLSVAPLRREADGLGSLEIDRGHPHVIYSRANPTRNPVVRIKAVPDIVKQESVKQEFYFRLNITRIIRS